jgi:hypothetical protein
MRPSIAAIAVLGIGLPAIAHADDRYPMMDHEQPVVCARDTEGKIWRIQCNAATKVCLYAADEELSADGQRVKPLERVRECDSSVVFDRPKLEAEGYTMLPGRPDAPWGWMRDERGRVFQINFDLRRRMYFGVGWSPEKILDNLSDPTETRRSKMDFGAFIFEFTDGRNRHRIRLLEGEVRVEPFSSEVVVAHYDMSRRFFDPLLRITTFVGEPQRHDLHMNLGLWTEAGGLEIHPTPFGHSSIWKHATAEGTLDLWQSADMTSFARIRTGFGLEGQKTDGQEYRSALTAASAFELDWVVDPAGFHNIKLEVSHEMPRYFVPVTSKGQRLAQRSKAKLSYEAIVLAINDQPLTFQLAAGGEKRNDIMGVPDRWAFVMDAGLRFSLWAPPRPRS